MLGLSILVSSAMVQAQAPAPVTSFRLLSLAGSYGGLYYEMNDSTKLRKVTLDQGLSPYYSRPSGPTLEIFREFPVPPGSPPGTKPVRKAGLIASIPEKTSRCIIVTIPQSTKRTDLLASHTLPDDSSDHRAGTVMAVNYSSFPAVIAMNDAQYPVAVGASVIIPCPANASEFIAQIALHKGNRWTPVYKAEFSTNPMLRGYLVFADYVQDPDYKASAIPPPALVSAVFEVSPEVPRLVKNASLTASLK